MNEDIINKILQENTRLKDELQATKEHLKKYTSPASRKAYYENNKEAVIQRVKKYNKENNYKPTPEQKKEYNRQSYLRRKEKLKKEMEEKQNRMVKKKKDTFQEFRSNDKSPYTTIKTTLKSVLRNKDVQPIITNLVLK